ncbi:MAG: ABC transporter permease [Firmicutes bacterium]|nr:ABC transporter permease [Bacillota bacterium]
MVLLIALTALAAPLLAPAGPTAADLSAILSPPGHGHLMGTDDLGRDVWARVVWGAGITLPAGLEATLLALLLGAPLGLVAGYFGGVAGEVILRATDVLLAFPSLVLALAMAAFLGPGEGNAILAIGIVSAPAFVRVARASVLPLRQREFVEAARSLGAGDGRILLRHVLPNAWGPVGVLAFLTVGSAILAETSLSFLGLGTQPPAPSWGAMVQEGADYLSQAPWISLYPGLAILVTVVSFNLLGNGLRQALAPRRG